ncbi:hypothetical protein Tco_0128782 [Tanacetum coccineum]
MSKILVLIFLLSLILGQTQLSLEGLLNNHTEFNKLLDDDVVRVCLLLALDFVFMGFELRHVIAKQAFWTSDDLSTWMISPGVVKWQRAFTKGIQIDDSNYIKVRNRLSVHLTPSSDEMKQKWWRMSLEYFHNVSKVDVRTNVHHDVDEGLSVPDVHHDVEEVEQFVNHHKTSKTGSDSSVTNVLAIDFVSLTENPHNRVALMKKITDMEVEFQRRITSIEDFLKIPRSPNLEKTSNVGAKSIAVDKNAGNKESMCVDSSVKVVEQNEFDQNVADKNLIHDFDQTVEWENLVNDEAISFKNSITQVDEPCQAPSVRGTTIALGAKKIAVDALMKIINFDIPKEANDAKSPIQPMVIETPVEGCKSGETSKSMISETQSHTCDSVEEANDANVQ